MNEKKSFIKRSGHAERRNNRSVLKDVKEFASSCNTVGRDEELEQVKNIPENADDSFSHGALATGQFRLSEIGDGATSNFIENRSFNFNSSSLKSKISENETNFDGDNFSNREKSLCVDKSDNVPTTLKSSTRVRHLPFRSISQETIANISKKIGKLKEEMINSGHGSKSAIPGRSTGMTSKKNSSALTKKKVNPIILPKEHFEVLQERIKTEIQNLKYLESSIACDTAGQKSNEEKEKADDDSDHDFDLEELGSDIQFLSSEEREILLRRYEKLKRDKSKSETDDKLVAKCEKEEVGIITIDLTKESTPCEVTEKTEVEAENEYPSLDLDFGSKIDWDDGEKEINHSTAVSEKPIVNLDIDESKLTVETSKKISDIKNRLARSLSIGLTHREGEKEARSECKTDSTVVNIPSEGQNALGEGESSVEDAEALELASLRCTSERTEVIADRERRRKRRCADYPGLAFGFSIFSSDTMMKFNIIRNELHNIMNTQLKRVCINWIFTLC